jgi:hypothetical protein
MFLTIFVMIFITGPVDPESDYKSKKRKTTTKTGTDKVDLDSDSDDSFSSVSSS